MKKQAEGLGLTDPHPDKKLVKYRTTFCKNLLDGIAYYRKLLRENETFAGWKEQMEQALSSAGRAVEELLTLAGKQTEAA